MFLAAFGTLALASCVSADRGDSDPSSDDDGTVQEPYTSVCNGGRFTCRSFVRKA